MVQLSERTVWQCEQCQVYGCAECLPVYAIHNVLICYWCKPAYDLALEEEAASKPNETVCYDSESSESEIDSEDSEAEECSVDCATEALANLFVGKKPARDRSEVLVQHRVRRTVHIIKNSNDEFMTCGRRISEQFVKLSTPPSFDWPQCKDCFGTSSLISDS